MIDGVILNISCMLASKRVEEEQHTKIPTTNLWSGILCKFVGALEQRVSSVTYMERINVALWLLGMNFNGKMHFFSQEP